ncbi:hypothetical protein [Pseudorhodoplanes sp.]|uniref:hypothetical protein n=1 Tax=Pseudorhodoplanes sp. TaxID=1934341 RepID=UPI003D099764
MVFHSTLLGRLELLVMLLSPVHPVTPGLDGEGYSIRHPGTETRRGRRALMAQVAFMPGAGKW